MWDFMLDYYKMNLFTDDQMNEAIKRGWITQEQFDKVKADMATFKAAHPEA